MADIAFLDMPAFLRRSKNKIWKLRMLKRGTILAKFVFENGLIGRNIEFCDELISPIEILYRSELNDEGLAFVKEGCIGRWYDSHDRGRPIEEIRILKNGLNRVRKFGARHYIDSNYRLEWATPDENE